MEQLWGQKQMEERFEGFEGNWEHLTKLMEGVESWNAWRDKDPWRPADLKGLYLPSTDSPFVGNIWRREEEQEYGHEGQIWYSADLRGANFHETDLSGADLSGANLGGCNLRHANLDGARLWGAVLLGANLGEAELRGADLIHANLQDAGLYRATLQDTNLGDSNLTNASLVEASLKGANFRSAKLEKASLRDSDLENAALGGAILAGADLRVKRPEDLRLDDTLVLHARFAPGSRDPWSVLRRTYSGPMLLFHLLFLVAFLLPYFGKAVFWRGVNQGQEAFALAQEKLVHELGAPSAMALAITRAGGDVETIQGAEWYTGRDRRDELDVEEQQDPTVEALERVLEERDSQLLETLEGLALIGRCLQKECREPMGLWRPLLGLDRDPTLARMPAWILPLLLLLYNACRGGFTWWISRLRDAEERSGWSPRLKDYLWAYRLHHYFLRWVAALGLGLVILQAWSWLRLEVVLPLG